MTVITKVESLSVSLFSIKLGLSDQIAIVDLIQSQGGVMTMEDLAECQAETIQPIKYEYKAKDGNDGVSLWEVSGANTFSMIPADSQCPPNGQGLTALVALGIIEALEQEKGIDLLELEHNSATYLHVLIEAMRLAFADSKLHVIYQAWLTSSAILRD
jgi:gamma-glutamyltranspeptidase/glutathione hydrolase